MVRLQQELLSPEAPLPKFVDAPLEVGQPVAQSLDQRRVPVLKERSGREADVHLLVLVTDSSYPTFRIWFSQLILRKWFFAKFLWACSFETGSFGTDSSELLLQIEIFAKFLQCWFLFFHYDITILAGGGGG
jgi:hypothetical protein